jgi:alpha-beta hydrolase superfamily lysophospholipase
LIIDCHIFYFPHLSSFGNIFSMSSTKPTVVIVPGAWQPADAFEPFAEQLKSAGYPALVVPVPSVGGTETPLAGLKEDSQAVSVIIRQLADEARDIVLLCHSYGGVVGSCAVGVFQIPALAL